MTTATGRVRIEGSASLGQIERATSRLRTSFRKLEARAEKAGREVREMGAELRGPLAAGAGVAVAALGALVNETLTTRLEIANLATQAGVSAKLFGALSLAADRSGASADQVAGAFKALTARIGQAAQGNQGLIDEFDALGVQIRDKSGALRDVESVFRDVVKSLGTMSDETNRAATAERLMGEAAYGLRQALGELSEDGLARAEGSARGFTAALTEEGIQAARDYEIAINKVSTATQSLGDLLSTSVGTGLNAVIDPLVYLSVFLADVFGKSVGTVVTGLKQWGEILYGVGAVAVAVANRDLAAAKSAIDDTTRAFLELDEANELPSFTEAAEKAARISAAFKLASGEVETFQAASNAAGSDFEETWGELGYVDQTTGKIVQTAEAVSSIGTAAQSAKTKITGAREELETLSEVTREFSASPLFSFGVAATAQSEAITKAAEVLRAYGIVQAEYAAQEARAIEESIAAQERAMETREAAASTFLQLSDLVQSVTGNIIAQAEASEELSEEQRRSALAAFAVEKAASLASAIVNTAVGVTQALAAAPPPLNLINAGLVGVAGGVAIAEIAAQQPSFALGGIMPTTGATATLHPGEGVLSAGAVDRMGGASALAASNARSGLQGGGTVVNVQWKHLRTSFNYEARDGRSRPGPLRELRRDGRRAGQRRTKQTEDYGAL